MNEIVHEQLKKIKQSFRLRMDGMISQSMRNKGLEYKINWGIPFYELKTMAKEYGKDYELAIELWKEDIRECKILATLIMPAERMDTDLIDVWMEGTISQEMAEMLAFNLYQYMEQAPVLAYKWMASHSPSLQICAFQLIARLFMKGQEPNERGINEYLDQVSVALSSEHIAVRHAAGSSLQKFADLGDEYRQLVENYLKSQNLDVHIS